MLWHKDIQNLWCGQILIVVTYKDRERHSIMYWKGFGENKPQVHIPPLNNHTWTRELKWLLKRNPTPLHPIKPLQAHLWHFPACTGWCIKGKHHLPLAQSRLKNYPARKKTWLTNRYSILNAHHIRDSSA